MTYAQIRKELESKKYRPIYFLHGTEPYYIDRISDYIEENVLSDAEKAFNQTIFYGKETDHLAVLDTARRYPMMAPYQVVIIKEAQEMKTLKNLESYFAKPHDSTILVICHKHKKFNLNSKLGKVLKKNAVIFESKGLYDNQVPDWVRDFLMSKKLKISPQNAALIAEYVGTDLSKITNELEKFAINLPAGSEITAAHIEEYIGISREYNIFEFQRALGNKDAARAFRIAEYFNANPRKNPFVLVVGTLYNYFSKVYMLHFLKGRPESEMVEKMNLRSAWSLKDYRAGCRHYSYQKTVEIIGLLKTYDLKSKGVEYNSVGKTDGALLKELTWQILN
ncbi:MAG: DNA polymerase III subunit delta [Bacteroidetes bacterium]|nr:MAG: DNA polymerase III subunit delta [Bacteroidota bacterium]